MRSATSLIVSSIVVAAAAARADVAPPPVEYTVRLDAPQTQMVGVSVRVSDVDEPELQLALPVWRPGRYQVLDPAGAVRDVTAASGDGRPLRVEKTGKSTWSIETAGADSVTVAYRLYANELGSRTRHVDDTHAFLSGESVFMYFPSRRDREVRVSIEAPAGWRVATGLESPGEDPRVRVAASYDVLVDSPFEIGLHDVLEFDVAGIPHEIVIWGDCEYDGARLVEDTRRIVETQRAIFGRLPYERYVFMIHAGAGAGGGTEHLNSTIMQTSCSSLEGSLENDRAYRRFLGLVSHEMFHTWNVKQFRPAGLTPYDYQRENYTRLLWVVEGATSYYDDLTLVRAGVVKPGRYLDRLGDAVTSLRKRPGARVQSLESSSFDAWIKFTRPDADSVNATVSFYAKGALASLLLDMHIRARSSNTASMDDVMRTLFERFPPEGPGYRPEDMVAIAGELAGDSLVEVFATAVRGTDPLDLESVLGVVGLELVFEPAGDGREDDEDGEGDDDGPDEDAPAGDGPGGAGQEPRAGGPVVREAAYLGLDLADRGGRAVVRSVRADGPAWSAGIIVDDEIVAMNARRLRAGDLDDRLERHQPGEVVTLHVIRRDVLRTFTVALAGRPDGTWEIRRLDDADEAQRAAYAQWLGQPWPDEQAAQPAL
ncbi:MAG: M61 family metallopeptidase [Planctomycetota bacterium]|jgi:predicted metalloprotease with PDZ domain